MKQRTEANCIFIKSSVPYINESASNLKKYNIKYLPVPIQYNLKRKKGPKTLTIQYVYHIF